MIGAGSGIRTHAARKGHRLSRPTLSKRVEICASGPTRRVNPLGPQDARPASVALSRHGPPPSGLASLRPELA